MLFNLTSPSVMSYRVLGEGWSVLRVLDLIAMQACGLKRVRRQTRMQAQALAQAQVQAQAQGAGKGREQGNEEGNEEGYEEGYEYGSTDTRYNALIDTGALVTGLSNEQVARHLMRRMLHHYKQADLQRQQHRNRNRGSSGGGEEGTRHQGVVFLDQDDKKMILLGKNMKVGPSCICTHPCKHITAYEHAYVYAAHTYTHEHTCLR